LLMVLDRVCAPTFSATNTLSPRGIVVFCAVGEGAVCWALAAAAHVNARTVAATLMIVVFIELLVG
jgi:hypothetical protein